MLIGLKRELKEELGIGLIRKATPRCMRTFYLEPKQAWLMWVVFDVKIDTRDFVRGEGVTAAAFVNPAEFKDSSDVFEKLVYGITQSSSTF